MHLHDVFMHMYVKKASKWPQNQNEYNSLCRLGWGDRSEKLNFFAQMLCKIKVIIIFEPNLTILAIVLCVISIRKHVVDIDLLSVNGILTVFSPLLNCYLK